MILHRYTQSTDQADPTLHAQVQRTTILCLFTKILFQAYLNPGEDLGGEYMCADTSCHIHFEDVLHVAPEHEYVEGLEPFCGDWSFEPAVIQNLCNQAEKAKAGNLRVLCPEHVGSDAQTQALKASKKKKSSLRRVPEVFSNNFFRMP